MRRLKIDRYVPELVTNANYGAYRMRIVVSEAEGPDITRNIFIFKREPPSPHTDSDVDMFQAVAGPEQMASIPESEPNEDLNWPYFRLSELEMDFHSSYQADTVYNEILREAESLIAAFNRLDHLRLQSEVWIPSAPEDSQSESVSQ